MFHESSYSPGFSSFFTIICCLLLVTLALGGYAVFTSLSKAATQEVNFKLPDYATDPEAVNGAELAYQAAAEMPELFSKIPCFCGCSLTGKHHSNLDCFVESWSADKIVFTSHGSTCPTSVSTALDVIRWNSEGLEAEEIRELVMDKYSQYGINTEVEFNVNDR